MKFAISSAALLALCQISQGLKLDSLKVNKLDSLHKFQEKQDERKTQANKVAVSEGEKFSVNANLGTIAEHGIHSTHDDSSRHLLRVRALISSACQYDLDNYNPPDVDLDFSNGLGDYDLKTEQSSVYNSLVSQCSSEGYTPYEFDVSLPACLDSEKYITKLYILCNLTLTSYSYSIHLQVSFSCSSAGSFTLYNMVTCSPDTCTVSDREEFVQNYENNIESGFSSGLSDYCTANVVATSLGSGGNSGGGTIPYDQETCFDAYDQLQDRYPQFYNYYEEIENEVSDCELDSTCSVDGQQVSQSEYDRNVAKCQEIGELTTIENYRIECSGGAGSTVEIRAFNIPECIPRAECGLEGAKDLVRIWEADIQEDLDNRGLSCNVYYETVAYEDDDGDSSNIGMIIGIVAGVVVLVVAIVAGVFFCRRKKGSSDANTVGVASAAAPKPQDVEPSVFVPGPASTEPVPAVPVANSTSVMIFTAPAAQPLGLTMGDRGSNNGYVIAAVKPTSPLLGQVQEGDELTSIDTTDLTVLDSTGMLEALRDSAKTGAERKLAIVRGSGGDV